MVMISNANTFIPREWKDTSLSLFSLLYFSCELAVLIIMLGDFSVLRDSHDGFDFVTRKANIVDNDLLTVTCIPGINNDNNTNEKYNTILIG